MKVEIKRKKRLENPGIDPGTSHMLSERSTIWANSPHAPWINHYQNICWMKLSFDIIERKRNQKTWDTRINCVYYFSRFHRILIVLRIKLQQENVQLLKK